ncbi:signal peptidase II [Nitrospirillum pindoramense]|uniref:Lipoprotein signal peptidase n=1 Tax=Nitrospirillum amazonense TaxID=28077 RepID=A0A560GPE1_9PROT|nr:signal peptidase II [Nitrospirillum amazonense]TWB35867.1 signal peptidase II [Nitrospirillum amazonense]
MSMLARVLGRFGVPGLVAAALVLAADQASKAAILGRFAEAGDGITLLPFFNLVLVWNHGVSFGLFNQGGATGTVMLIVLALVITAAMAVWMRRAARLVEAVCAGMVIGGALGNVIDRLRLGAVVDFLDFHIAAWHWPAFNVADSGIVVGMLVLVVDGLFVRPATR